tara:strand:+ start:107 stop:295 length:189 start_codon:yes stop_codon:yes gene_type:complete
MNLTNILMKTYTISEDLFTAIIESVYHKGRCSINIIKHEYDEKEVLKRALKTIRDQQFVYED